MAKKDTKETKGGKPKPQQAAQNKQQPKQDGRQNAAQAAAARSTEATSDGASGSTVPAGYVPRMKQQYENEVVPALMREFGYGNRMQVPQIKKLVLNIGMGSEARDNAKAIDSAAEDVTTITGQRPVVTRAKKSIAAFKLREGMPVGVTVTLRGSRMYDFYDKLVNIALARVRDFSGVSAKSFDGHGNFTLGLREQLIFPEINYDKVDKIRGMEVVVVTSARNDQEGRRLLELMGMPFKK